MLIAGHMALLQRSNMNTSVFQRFQFSSLASAEPSEKEDAQSLNGAPNQKDVSGSTPESQSQMSQSRRSSVAFADSESEIEELSRGDLEKLVKEKEQLLMVKQKKIASMQDKVLRTYIDMENVMDRTKCEAENTKKFALQSFAKGLQNVADNLNRASSIVKESFSKINTSRDASGVVPLLKTLLEGVEMTEKQLAEVFKKFGVEKYDPTYEQFDSNRHYGVLQVSDAFKPPGTIADVLKVFANQGARLMMSAKRLGKSNNMIRESGKTESGSNPC